jgi:hypothetical protein
MPPSEEFWDRWDAVDARLQEFVHRERNSWLFVPCLLAFYAVVAAGQALWRFWRT